MADPAAVPGTDQLGDQVLAAAASAGERDAFEALIGRHGRALHRYARRMVRDDDAADDITQSTFIAAWRQIGGFRGDASLRTWLFAICAHKIADSRRVKHAQPIDDRLFGPVTGPGADDPFVFASTTEFLAALERALDELPVRQRAAWVLHEIEELTFVQIGVILKLSPDAVRGHHRRARTTLRQRMQRWR
jgi:RNA polymerase sigma-70 factor (ECF subfamily)